MESPDQALSSEQHTPPWSPLVAPFLRACRSVRWFLSWYSRDTWSIHLCDRSTRLACTCLEVVQWRDLRFSWQWLRCCHWKSALGIDDVWFFVLREKCHAGSGWSHLVRCKRSRWWSVRPAIENEVDWETWSLGRACPLCWVSIRNIWKRRHRIICFSTLDRDSLV